MADSWTSYVSYHFIDMRQIDVYKAYFLGSGGGGGEPQITTGRIYPRR